MTFPLRHRTTPEAQALRALIAKNLKSDLGLYLRRVAQATVLGVALSACSASHSTEPDGSMPPGDAMVLPDGGGVDGFVPPPPPPPPPRDGGPRPEPGPYCNDALQWDALSGIDPSLSPPYVALYEQQIFSFGGPGYFQVTQERGVACEGATDAAACRTELDRLIADTGTRALLYTDFDGAHAITTPGQLLELMGGRLETPNSVALYVWMHGYEILCNGPYITSIERSPDGGWDVVAFRFAFDGSCNLDYYQVPLYVDGMEHTVEAAGPETYLGVYEIVCAVGRRPAGLRASALPRNGGPVADFFAEVARLEESAVSAFDQMIDELTTLGAPEPLLAAAREAREDEVRHTDDMGALARAFGVEPGHPVIDAPAGRRSAYEIAFENAVEGCVRETYGALVAAHQALTASDPRVAAAMQTVAADEIRHAELSWALAGWLEPQLTDAERAEIEAAKRRAIDELRVASHLPVHPSLVEVAGMPSPEANAQMIEQLAADIWA